MKLCVHIFARYVAECETPVDGDQVHVNKTSHV